MANSKKLFRVTGEIKHYDWGGKTFLPSLLHLPAEEGKPYAEYWLGAGLHPEAGTLPYLFKVLDVEKMLSIQVHPSREAAREGFERENLLGIPRDAPLRSFRDDNHKPELASPLGGFYLLHGFKPPSEMKRILGAVPELQFLLPVFGEGDYREMYTRVMRMPQEEVNAILQPLLQRIVPLYRQGRLEKDQEDFWAARADETFNAPGIIDRGIFSIYFFNLVRMSEGDGLYQGAGMPHAYLEGQTMEIMANSDNVLRGGLTVKHIDVEELLKHVVFEPTVPRIIKASLSLPSGPPAAAEQVFDTPAGDFQMSRIRIGAGGKWKLPVSRRDIFFLYRGAATVTAGSQQLTLGEGEALLTEAGSPLEIAAGRDAILYRATVPDSRK